MPHPLTHGAPLLLGRSAYSFLRGTARPADLAAAAARGGHAALALADRENLCGAIDFLDAARHHGLQPILGAEWVVPLRILGGSSRDRGSAAGEARLILLCRDVVGYRTLCRLLSRLHLQGPEAAGRFLRSAPAGLIALAESVEAWPPLREIFGPADLYGLLVRPGNPRDEHRSLQQATRQSIRVVASSNAFIASSAEERTSHLLRAIRRHGFLAAAGANKARAARGGPIPTREPPGLLIDAAAMARRFADLPEALVRSRELIERCRLCLEDLTPGRFILPSLRGREGLGALRSLCEAGLARRGLLHSPAACERLATELRVVEILGFWDYFLVVGDIVGWARERGIRIVGRGSGAASIIAYLLGVTNVDPLREGLCFERFFHPLRRDLPDLDVDIAWDRREEVMRYALSRFGEGRAAIMGTHPAWRARGAFREAARALGLPDARIAEGCRRLPYAFFGERQSPEGGVAEEGTDVRALRALVRDGASDLVRAARAALGLVGLPRHLGTHPGGVVLADRPLEEIVALQISPGGFAVTQLEMRAAARVGLVKIDLLGNRSLGTIDETIRSIRAARVEGRADDGDGVASAGRSGANNGDGVAPAGPGGGPGRAAAWAELDNIPDRDPRAAELLARAETLGCLQLESPAMRTLLRQLGARDVGMLVAAIALIRPGPAGSGMKLAFVRRVRGLEEPLALHPALRPVLVSTFGLPLYDEDVIAMAATIAGGTLAEGDLLRRAVAEGVRRAKAGDPGAEDSLRRLERGFRGAAGAQGIDRRAVGEVWETLVRFAAYSFCKAHAAGYGLIAYQCAWLKAHFPGPFFAALL
ncbi:MAG: DNA polymerase III subunit alpha, partial [Candidatus Eisenbacteria bacterium]